MKDDDPFCHNLISTHHVTRQDTIDYLLNPRGKSTRLPNHTIEKLKKDKDAGMKSYREHTVNAANKLIDLEREFHVSSKSRPGGFLGLRAQIESEENSLNSDMLITSGKDGITKSVDKTAHEEFLKQNSHRLPPIHIHKKRNEIVTNSVLNDRVDTNKGQLWNIMDRAQDISKHLRGKSEEVSKSPVGKLPKSSSGLKQHSLKLSQAAKRNPLVSGHQTVIAEDYDSLRPKRLLDVKKYVSTKRLGSESERSIYSDQDDDENEGEDGLKSDRKRSIYYNMAEGTKLVMVQEGGKLVIKSATGAQMVVQSNESTSTDMQKMSGENMMKLFKDQLLKRTFESLNQLTVSTGRESEENIKEAMNMLMDEQVSKLNENVSIDFDRQDVSVPATTATTATQSTRHPQHAQHAVVIPHTLKQKKEAVAAQAVAHAAALAQQAVTWNVMEKPEHAQGTSLLLLPEKDEVRYLNQFREREELKLKAKDEVMKALAFVTKSSKTTERSSFNIDGVLDASGGMGSMGIGNEYSNTGNYRSNSISARNTGTNSNSSNVYSTNMSDTAAITSGNNSTGATYEDDKRLMGGEGRGGRGHTAMKLGPTA